MKDHHRIRFWNQAAEKFFYQSKDRGNWFVPEDLPDIGASFNFMELLEAGCVQENCTGLRDKNGVLIFEGDRLKSRFPEEKEQRTYIVKYSDANGCWLAILEEYAGRWIYGGDFKDCVIIGNIHQKP